jgi:hypothetical protein
MANTSKGIKSMSNPLTRLFNPPTTGNANQPERLLPSPVQASTGINGDPIRFGVNSNHNPFAVAQNTASRAFMESYGVNKPLSSNQFVGYWDDKAVYAGANLFMLA